MPSTDHLFVYRGWYRWSVLLGPFLAISPPFWPWIGAVLLNDAQTWNNVERMPVWGWLLLIAGAAIFLWAYSDLQFWRRDIRVSSDYITSLVLGWPICCLRWGDIKSISILEIYNQDRMKREVRCRLQAEARAIGFKDYIQGYAVLLAIVESKAEELGIPVNRGGHSDLAT